MDVYGLNQSQIKPSLMFDEEEVSKKTQKQRIKEFRERVAKRKTGTD